MQRPRFAAPGLLILVILLLAGVAGAAPALARQEATPPVGTPAAQPEPTAAPAQPTAVPAATPAAPAQTDVVTLVLWYANPLDREIIELFPLQIGAGFVATAQPGAAPVGTVDFPAEGVPTVVIGDTTFETYPRPDGFVERWTWFDDFEGARPGTLVMQLAGLDGTYRNYFGTATFVSRDEGGVGGVLTLALRPPSPAAAAATPAAATTGEGVVAGAVSADAAAVDEAAVQPEATVDPGTEILVEPGGEGEAPVTEGGAPLEPGG